MKSSSSVNKSGKNRTLVTVFSVLLLLVVAITLGYIAYRQTTKSKQQATVTTKQPNILAYQKAPSNTIEQAPGTSFHITELTATFTLPSSLADIIYQVVHLTGDQAVESVAFSTKTLAAANCPASKAPLGYLTYNAHDGGQQVKGAPLFFIAPTGSCASLSQSQTLAAALVTIVPDGWTQK